MEVHSIIDKSYWKSQVWIGVFYGIFLGLSFYTILVYEYKSLFYWAGLAVFIMTTLHIKNIVFTSYVNLHITETKITVTNFIFKKSFPIYYDQIENIKTIEHPKSNNRKVKEEIVLMLEENKILNISMHQYSNYKEIKEAIYTNRKPVDFE